MRWLRGLLVLLVFAFAAEVEASNAKSEVILEMQRIEHQIRKTRWNLNTLDKKKALKKELALLKRLYDKIIKYEGELMAFPCAGATIDPEGGPPISSEGSDTAGLLGQGARGAAQIPGRGSGRRASSSGEIAIAGQAGAGPGFAFIRSITDVEVRLLAQIVFIEYRLEKDDWHWNNLGEQKALKRELEFLKDSLRRVRNGRC